MESKYINYQGQIQLICGPMFSGKTTELLRRLRRYQHANYKCIAVKHKIDNRFNSNDELTSHDCINIIIPSISTDNLNQINILTMDYKVIGIDEGQFFNDIAEFAEKCANMGKIVIIAALDGSFQRKPFKNILSIIPMAECIKKLPAVCMICFNDASFTKRISLEKELEIIGGKEKYIAVCRKCYFV